MPRPIDTHHPVDPERARLGGQWQRVGASIRIWCSECGRPFDVPARHVEGGGRAIAVTCTVCGRRGDIQLAGYRR